MVVEAAEHSPRRKRTSPSATEIALLAVGLAALAFAAGAGGWVLGRESKSSAARTVTVTATTAPTTTRAAAKGNPAAGKAIFANAGCGSCHTLKAAGASGTVAPNLDQANLSPAAIIGWVTDGKGNMPAFKDQLNRKQIADLAAFIARPVSP